MPETRDPFDMTLTLLLEENLRLHAIGAEIFAPFVIERLGGGNEITSAELTVILTDAEGQEQTKGVPSGMETAIRLSQASCRAGASENRMGCVGDCLRANSLITGIARSIGCP